MSKKITTGLLAVGGTLLILLEIEGQIGIASVAGALAAPIAIEIYNRKKSTADKRKEMSNKKMPSEDDLEFQLSDLLLALAKEYSYYFWGFGFIFLSLTLSVSLASFVHLHIMPVEIIEQAYANMDMTLESAVYKPGMYVSIVVQALGWLACLHSLVANAASDFSNASE